MSDFIEFHIMHKGERHILRADAPYSVQMMDEFAVEFASLLQKLGVDVKDDLSVPSEAVIEDKRRIGVSQPKTRGTFDLVTWGYLKTQL